MKHTATLRPEVEPTKRKAMTDARKLRIHTLAEGRCGCGCGDPVPVSGPGVIYDHEIMIEHGGADEWPNLRAVLTACDRPKTAQDLRRNGKTRRQRKKLSLAFERPKPKRPILSSQVLPKGRKLRSPKFPKGRKRPIPSRSFP